MSYETALDIVNDMTEEQKNQIINADDVRVGYEKVEEGFVGRIVDYPDDGLLRVIYICPKVFDSADSAIEAMRDVILFIEISLTIDININSEPDIK